MNIDGKTILTCDCGGTMSLDGLSKSPAHQLCRGGIDAFKQALAPGQTLIVACGQEAPVFAEVAADACTEADLVTVDIRDRAGWSDEGKAAIPKMAALLAEAALDNPPALAVTMASGGALLILGRDEAAIAAARAVAGRMDVTVMLDRPGEVIPPPLTDITLFRGTAGVAKGHLGAFEITADGFAAALPSSRGFQAFAPARDGVAVTADVILDMTGNTALFQAPGKRDGYLRADPANPAAVQAALLEATGLVGEFEKPQYVELRPELCAHSRNRLVGCTRCLDLCPTGAIQPKGDVVAIDPFICAGCGQCAAACPTGAAAYTLPDGDLLFRRLATLLAAYHRAGGTGATLLIHDRTHGAEAIALMARFGRGLPAKVIPFAVNEVTQVPAEAMMMALAYGAVRVSLLVPPAKRHEMAGAEAQTALANALTEGLGLGSRMHLIDEADPDAVADGLYALPRLDGVAPASFTPVGGKRTVMRLALGHLRARTAAKAEAIALPTGASYGAVAINVEGCTLCLSCVSACPTKALRDAPDKPSLSFVEDACIQCGLCRVTCPEKVVSLTPRYSFAEAARAPLLLKEEEPFHCVRCGKPFGAKSSIEKIAAKLASHPMFAGAALERIRMCDDCRVIDQFSAPQPMALGTVPVTRTTDDDLRERAEKE